MQTLSPNKHLYHNTSYKLSAKKAFSLIEILLVIAVLGVIRVLLFNLLQQNEQEVKIKKTALQIQLISSAADTYRLREGKWPMLGDEKFTQDYLPGGITNNPWGGNYTYGPADDSGKRFRIATIIDNVAVAAQIRALLANVAPASNPSDSNIIVETPLPSQLYMKNFSGLFPNRNGHLLLLGPGGAGSQGMSASFSVPSCTGNQEIIVLPDSLSVQFQGDYEQIRFKPYAIGITPPPTCDLENNSCQFTFFYQGKIGDWFYPFFKNNPSIGVNFLTFCGSNF